LTDWFDTNGEPQPSKMQVAYNKTNLEDLHKEYQNSPIVNRLTIHMVSYPQFTRLIREVFPNCVQNEYKTITGKCDPCENMRNASRLATLSSDKILIRGFQQMHRNNVIGEKLKYYDRRHEAIISDGKVVSYIFDGMSKDKTRLPIMGNETSLEAEFSNNVIGCISHHDQKTRFYCSFGSVQTGASLMIHCIHSEIERLIDERQKANEPMPEKIYLQIDGAADNTAYAVMAALEHLVAADLVHTIEIWRLPVGHTHEVSTQYSTLLYPLFYLLINNDIRYLYIPIRTSMDDLVLFQHLSEKNIYIQFHISLTWWNRFLIIPLK